MTAADVWSALENVGAFDHSNDESRDRAYVAAILRDALDAARADAQQERNALRAALEDATEGLDEMLPYVPDYFVEKWDLQGYVTRAHAVLNATGRNP